MTVAEYRGAYRHFYDIARTAGASHEAAACLAGDGLTRLMREDAARQRARRAACRPRSPFADLSARRTRLARDRDAFREMRAYLDGTRRRATTPGRPTRPSRTPARPIRTRPVRPVRRMRGARHTGQRPARRAPADPPGPHARVLIGGAA